jgi:GH15 family glucan-1,4-alpha-glucosidase
MDGSGESPSQPTRRTVVSAAAAAVAAAGTGFGGLQLYRSRRAEVPLHSETVALDGPGTRVLVPQGRASVLVPGTRVLRTARDADALVEQEQAWLAAGAPWTATGPWSELARSALLDLRVLTPPNGIPVAGWSSAWRYVWPRDLAHHAAALAVTGHAEEALAGLRFLGRVQEPSGWFEARYLPDGSGPPDGRGRQLDGTGWVLWATARVAEALPASRARALVTELRPMVERSASLIHRLVDTPSGLPPASPDFWETPETRLTLGTVAPLVAGLSCAATMFTLLGDSPASAAARHGALELRAAVDRSFGADGYPRYAAAGEPDAAVAFLLPPYADSAVGEVPSALAKAEVMLRRPAGGLAPGAGWKGDGISWTPETTLFALAHAHCGDIPAAENILHWVASHRTAAGSLPEKVLHDGSPAAVAPLGWTASLVILTIAALQGPPIASQAPV